MIRAVSNDLIGEVTPKKTAPAAKKLADGDGDSPHSILICSPMIIDAVVYMT